MRERVDSLLGEVEERKKLLTDSQAIELALDKSLASHSLYAAQAMEQWMALCIALDVFVVFLD
jgi:hypothetical protein